MNESFHKRKAVVEHFEDVSAEWGQHYRRDVCEISEFDLVARRATALHFLHEITRRSPGRLRVLDVGCGSGDVLSAADSNRWQILGVDLVEAMVRQAAQHFPDSSLAVADATRLPFRSESIDVVTCLGVLEYVPEWQAALAAAWRVLRAGGHLVISFPNRKSWLRRFGRFEAGAVRRLRVLKRRRSPDGQAQRGAYQRTEWSQRESAQALTSAGFRIRDVRFNTYGVKGRFGDRSKLNLALARRLDGRLTSNSLIARSFAWTMVFWCEKPAPGESTRQP